MKMKHSLIAMAVTGLAGTAVVTPVMADATAYGIAQVELTSYSLQSEHPTNCDGDGATASSSDGSSPYGCDGLLIQDKSMGRFGVKASEDLGNGWTGLAKAEFQADYADGLAVDNNQDAIHSRELMVGLKGAGVEIQAGMLKSAYKYTGGVKYDPFVATALEARRDNGGMSHTRYGQGGFLPQTVAVMGKAGPVKYWLTYGAGDGTGDMTASVMFEQEAFEVFVAMADKGETSNAGAFGGGGLPPYGGGIGDPEDDYSATKIGGAYKAGPLKVKVQYEMVEIKNNTPPASPKSEPTYTFLGAEYKMGKNVFVLQLGQYDGDGKVNTTAGSPGFGKKVDTSYLAVGVIHKFTKDTRLFAGYRTSDADDESEEDAITVGLRKNF